MSSVSWWSTWQVSVPLAFLVGLVMIFLSLWRERRRDRRKWGPPTPDQRDWQGLVMRDFKETPRSWR